DEARSEDEKTHDISDPKVSLLAECMDFLDMLCLSGPSLFVEGLDLFDDEIWKGDTEQDFLFEIHVNVCLDVVH
ncbi:hypothetical protein KI387_040393, partial [Taxus chinensis]